MKCWKWRDDGWWIVTAWDIGNQTCHSAVLDTPPRIFCLCILPGWVPDFLLQLLMELVACRSWGNASATAWTHAPRVLESWKWRVAQGRLGWSRSWCPTYPEECFGHFWTFWCRFWISNHFWIFSSSHPDPTVCSPKLIRLADPTHTE